MLFLLIKLVPRVLFSYWMGKLAKTHLPKWVLVNFLEAYCRFYAVNMQELTKTLPEFKTFHQFFTRELKAGARKIDTGEKIVVSPVDGVVSACGNVKKNQLLQVKGIYYTLDELLNINIPNNNKTSPQILNPQSFIDGFFITLYLSPKDYHRIHSPVAGKLGFCQRTGKDLWPVNELAIHKVPALFAKNKRLISQISVAKTQVLLVAVGAMIVGGIHWNFWDSELANSNSCSVNQSLKAGQELGYFELGSTLVLLFPKNHFSPKKLQANQRLNMGEEIGRLI